MKTLHFIFLIVVVILCLESCATSARVTVSARPHRPVYVMPGRAPHPGWIWVGGEWLWHGGRYVYKSGHWMAPRRGYVWVPGHWQRMGRGWHWFQGHWRNV